ncbi:class I SAM-dependent methyltransferase [Kiloniella laminariae]|uniref:class I SAM-dependent methyltransferase n=1 Tax=Kiloniella laminariae TaxID=454162 RepID=UPI00039C4187|nr:class I SAM-dependent methyltransferase [Kiloniella laminariae]
MNETALLEGFSRSKTYESRLQHLHDSATLSMFSGYSLEFGVYKAVTLNSLADANPAHKFWGFDSFQGLPEPWYRSYDKTNVTPQKWFALEALPDTSGNVELVVGLFENSLPNWLAEHEGPVSFIHVDCDLYSSTKTILGLLNERILPGTIITFDELLDCPGIGYESWKEGEWKALLEWITKYKRSVQPLSKTNQGQASLKVIK